MKNEISLQNVCRNNEVFVWRSNEAVVETCWRWQINWFWDKGHSDPSWAIRLDRVRKWETFHPRELSQTRNVWSPLTLDTENKTLSIHYIADCR